jgi:hypothetical protein
VGDIFVAAEQSGLKTNQDVNSGDPLGMGIGSVCIYEGRRLTASIAYLSQPPSNLTICTDSTVAKILFAGQKATGVKTIDGRIFYSEKEVIISGGAINTPQILMLSGVGPKEELEKHGIPILHYLPQLGNNLQDHCFSTIGIVMGKDSNTIAEAQQSPTPMGLFDLPSVRSSQEYEILPKQTKEFLSSPTIPIIEIATVGMLYFLNTGPSQLIKHLAYRGFYAVLHCSTRCVLPRCHLSGDESTKHWCKFTRIYRRHNAHIRCSLDSYPPVLRPQGRTSH